MLSSECLVLLRAGMLAWHRVVGLRQTGFISGSGVRTYQHCRCVAACCSAGVDAGLSFGGRAGPVAAGLLRLRGVLSRCFQCCAERVMFPRLFLLVTDISGLLVGPQDRAAAIQAREKCALLLILWVRTHFCLMCNAFSQFHIKTFDPFHCSGGCASCYAYTYWQAVA